FFFQAEDGIRDDLVTGVQTCALPIYLLGDDRSAEHRGDAEGDQRDDGDQAVAQHVAQYDEALTQALGPRRPDVVERQMLEHLGADRKSVVWGERGKAGMGEIRRRSNK